VGCVHRVNQSISKEKVADKSVGCPHFAHTQEGTSGSTCEIRLHTLSGKGMVPGIDMQVHKTEKYGPYREKTVNLRKN
jgi:hypothetical protein